MVQIRREQALLVLQCHRRVQVIYGRVLVIIPWATPAAAGVVIVARGRPQRVSRVIA